MLLVHADYVTPSLPQQVSGAGWINCALKCLLVFWKKKKAKNKASIGCLSCGDVKCKHLHFTPRNQLTLVQNEVWHCNFFLKVSWYRSPQKGNTKALQVKQAFAYNEMLQTGIFSSLVSFLKVLSEGMKDILYLKSWYRKGQYFSNCYLLSHSCRYYQGSLGWVSGCCRCVTWQIVYSLPLEASEKSFSYPSFLINYIRIITVKTKAYRITNKSYTVNEVWT